MNTRTAWQLNAADWQLIDMALAEDLGQPYQDITSQALFVGAPIQGAAKIISKHPEPIVVCGLPMVKAILTQFAAQEGLHTDYQEGQFLQPGATLLTLEAPAMALLMMERTLLNFLQQLSAIATLTAKYHAKIKHTSMKILDTRKTLPGFRHLAKYAVHCGGGVNHRMGLYDAMMIKDTHVDLVGGMEKALAKLPEDVLEKTPVTVEVRDKKELEIVLTKGLLKVSRVLLDNMSCALLKECVAICQGKIATEASGNIDLENIAAIAETGVDFASVGKLTHSAGNVDLSMQCDFES